MARRYRSRSRTSPERLPRVDVSRPARPSRAGVRARCGKPVPILRDDRRDHAGRSARRRYPSFSYPDPAGARHRHPAPPEITAQDPHGGGPAPLGSPSYIVEEIGVNIKAVVPIQIASNRRRRAGIPDGWKPLFDLLVSQLGTLDPVPIIAAADQRFGRLRIGLAHPDARADGMMAEAVDSSATTCDRCGSIGTLRRTPDAEWARRCDMQVDLPAQFPTSERLRMIEQRSSLVRPAF